MEYYKKYIKGLMQKHFSNKASEADINIMLTVLDLYSEDEISAMIEDLEFDFTLTKTLTHTVPQCNSSSISNDFYLLLQRIKNTDGINTDHNEVSGINGWFDYSCN